MTNQAKFGDLLHTVTHGERIALSVLADSVQPMTPGEIGSDSGLSTATIRNYMVNWRKRGLVIHDENSVRVRISLTDHAMSSLRQGAGNTAQRIGVTGDRGVSPACDHDEGEVDELLDQIMGLTLENRALEDQRDLIKQVLTEVQEFRGQVVDAENLIVEHEELRSRLQDQPDELEELLRRPSEWAGEPRAFATVMQSLGLWLSEGRPTGMAGGLTTLIGGDGKPGRLREFVNKI